MAATYAIYYGITVLSCLFAWLGERLREKPQSFQKLPISSLTLLLILSALPMILVSGFRWNTGVDSQNYYWIFTNIYYGLNTHVEIGFRFLCRLLHLFTLDVSVLFLICSVITVTLVILSIRQNSANVFWSVFLFFVMGYFFYSMNSIRHYMALAIYLVAFRFLKQQKFLPYAGLILVAACFHKTALVALPLYFLLTIRWKSGWYGGFAAALLLLAIFHRPLLDLLYQIGIFTFYRDIEADYVSVSWWNILVSLILSGLGIYYKDRLLSRNPGNLVLLNSAWFGLLFFSLCSWIPEYTRIGQYCGILILFFVPEILAIEEHPVLKRLYEIGLLLGGLTFMGILIWQAQDPHLALAPYHSLLFRESYPLPKFWF